MIGNDDEIGAGADPGEYKKIREKVVGKTLRVKPDAQPATKVFLDAVEDELSREFLTQHRDKILEVFAHSGADNLRILKH